MKPRIALSILVLAVIVLGIPATAAVTNYTGDVYVGWNLIAVPIVPLDPDPLLVFNSIDIDYKLTRFDSATQSNSVYDEFSTDLFGNILIGEGYWLKATVPGNYTFSGLDDVDSMDVWISLPNTPWSLIANPYSYGYPWEDIKVTNGEMTVSMYDAVYTLSWIDAWATYFDAATQSNETISFPDEFPMSEELLPGHGFWIKSNVSKLALILEAKL